MCVLAKLQFPPEPRPWEAVCWWSSAIHCHYQPVPGHLRAAAAVSRASPWSCQRWKAFRRCWQRVFVPQLLGRGGEGDSLQGEVPNSALHLLCWAVARRFSPVMEKYCDQKQRLFIRCCSCTEGAHGIAQDRDRAREERAVTLLFPADSFSLGWVAIRAVGSFIYLLGPFVQNVSVEKPSERRGRGQPARVGMRTEKLGSRWHKCQCFFTVAEESLLRGGKIQSCKCGWVRGLWLAFLRHFAKVTKFFMPNLGRGVGWAVVTKGLGGVEVAIKPWGACGLLCRSLAAWLGLDKTVRPSFFEMFYNLPFKTTVKLVSQLKLLVRLSRLKLDALLGVVTAIQKKLKPNIAWLPENVVAQTCLHVSWKKVCICQARTGP